MTKPTKREQKVAALEKIRDKHRTNWGSVSVTLGNQRIEHNVVPSPSWALDYKTGIGGFPYRHMVEVYGANSLGKSSAFAYPILSNVQAQDKIPALLAAEPQFDIEWAQRLGVDPELMLLYRPDHADEAFEMMHDLVYQNQIDYIIVDSLGALAAKSEAAEDGGGKKKAYGISGTVTSGLNAIMPRMYKNGIGMLILNQQRQAGTVGNSNVMQYESPGGEGLHHNAVMRIQLKPGGSYKATVAGENEVIVGRQLICNFRKNKMGLNAKTARFDFYYVESEKYENKFGVDRMEDVINTGKLTGVLKGSAWLEHPIFPGGKLHGRDKVKEFLMEHPEAIGTLREDVIRVMSSEQIEAKRQADLKVVENDG